MSAAVSPTERLRRQLGASTDPRAARTRTALIDAACDLAVGRSAVTVSAVTRRAGVSRATYYSHFSSLDDLALGVMEGAFHDIAALYVSEPGDPVEAMRRSQRRLVEYFAANAATFRTVNGLSQTRAGYLAGVRTMAIVIEQVLAEHSDRPVYLQTAAVSRYIAGAAYGLIDAWLTDEIALSEEQLVEHLVALLPPWFSGYDRKDSRS